MCSPTLAIVGVSAGLQVASGVTGYMGARQSAKSAEAVGRYNAEVTRTRTAIERAQFLREAADLRASQRAAGASRGLDIGNVAAIVGSTAQRQAFDELALRYSGEATARGQEYEGRARAASDRASGTAALIAGLSGAASTGASGYLSATTPLPGAKPTKKA